MWFNREHMVLGSLITVTNLAEKLFNFHTFPVFVVRVGVTLYEFGNRLRHRKLEF